MGALGLIAPRGLPAAALLACVAAACAPEEPDSRAAGAEPLARAGGAGAEAAPSPDGPPRAADGLYALCAEARGMPLVPPAVPPAHYFARGRATFDYADGEPVEQELTLSMGGPARLSYELAGGRRRNIFLLESAERASRRLSGKDEWEDHDPAELHRDTWARWTLTYFPWGWEETLRAAETAEDANPAGRALALEGPYGEFTLQLDPEGRPQELRAEGVRLRVESGGLAQGSKQWTPRKLSWSKTWGELVEDFDIVYDRIPIEDATFRRTSGSLEEEDWREHQLVALTADGAEEIGDRLGVVPRAGVTILVGPAAADWVGQLEIPATVRHGSWLRIHADGSRDAAVAWPGAAPAQLPVGVRSEAVPAAKWFRWTTRKEVAEGQAAGFARAWAEENGRRPAGPVWIWRDDSNSPLRLREFLLRLEAD